MNNTQTGTSGQNPSDMKDELKDDGAKLAQTAKDRATTIAKEQKSKATGVASSAASALGTAADELKQDSDTPDWLASAFRQVADTTDEFASSVSNKEPKQIASEISRFGKANPGAFLALSAVAGFVAARFLRAGAEHRSHDTGNTGSLGGSTFDANPVPPPTPGPVGSRPGAIDTAPSFGEPTKVTTTGRAR